MDIFLAGTPVALTIALQDRNGNSLNATAVEYRIVNQAGVEVLSRAPLADFAGGSEVTVEIPMELNVIATIDPAAITSAAIDSVFVRESRTVELFVTDDAGNTILLTSTYILEPVETLIVGLNSFQAFSQAELIAMDIPNLPAWSDASEKDKVAALVEARLQICQLRFSNIRQDGQSHLSEVVSIGDLALVTPAQFSTLSPRFKLALCRAQVVQADAVLGGDPVELKRREGLVLETIGESKQMFRSGKPLELPVSKRALKYLSPFVSFSQRIGRG